MDAFDADVLIYAVAPGHPLGRAAPVRRGPAGMSASAPWCCCPRCWRIQWCCGQVLARPLRNGSTREVTELTELLSRLDLRPADPFIAEAATSLAAAHRLRAADAFHLATAVVAGADRFITNNRRDFGPSITEIEIVYPDALDGAVTGRVTAGRLTGACAGPRRAAARLEAASFWRIRATCCSTVFGEM